MLRGPAHKAAGADCDPAPGCATACCQAVMPCAGASVDTEWLAASCGLLTNCAGGAAAWTPDGATPGGPGWAACTGCSRLIGVGSGGRAHTGASDCETARNRFLGCRLSEGAEARSIAFPRSLSTVCGKPYCGAERCICRRDVHRGPAVRLAAYSSPRVLHAVLQPASPDLQAQGGWRAVHRPTSTQSLWWWKRRAACCGQPAGADRTVPRGRCHHARSSP